MPIATSAPKCDLCRQPAGALARARTHSTRVVLARTRLPNGGAACLCRVCWGQRWQRAGAEARQARCAHRRREREQEQARERREQLARQGQRELPFGGGRRRVVN
jgi:hypothetical protein